MMGGWKTWMAALGAFALGLYEIYEGRTESGIGHLTFAAGMVGIGHKIEKNAANG